MKLLSKRRLHGKNDFAGYRSENNFVGIHQNNFIGTLKIMCNAVKNFDILTTSLSILHNYSDSLTK